MPRPIFTNNLMNKLPLFAALLGLGLTACQTEDPATCHFVQDVTANATGCYSPAAGLTLTASGYGTATGFEWSVYEQADTVTRGNFISPNRRIRTSGGASFTLPDTLLRRVPAVGVLVRAACEDGSYREPVQPFTFVKRQGAGGCVVWARKNF